jgi:hypothetical protein
MVIVSEHQQYPASKLHCRWLWWLIESERHAKRLAGIYRLEGTKKYFERGI